jgi:hypothetical protein
MLMPHDDDDVVIHLILEILKCEDTVQDACNGLLATLMMLARRMPGELRSVLADVLIATDQGRARRRTRTT